MQTVLAVVTQINSYTDTHDYMLLDNICSSYNKTNEMH